MDQFVTAVVASLVTVIATRLLTVPVAVRRNDLLIRNRNDDLRTWVLDDDKALEADIQAKLQDINAAGLLHSGAPIQSRDKATRWAEHRYRDQQTTAERVLRDTAASETVSHGLYRKLARKPMPALTAPQDVSPILARWRGREPSGPQRIAA